MSECWAVSCHPCLHNTGLAMSGCSCCQYASLSNLGAMQPPTSPQHGQRLGTRQTPAALSPCCVSTAPQRPVFAMSPVLQQLLLLVLLALTPLHCIARTARRG